MPQLGRAADYRLHAVLGWVTHCDPRDSRTQGNDAKGPKNNLKMTRYTNQMLRLFSLPLIQEEHMCTHTRAYTHTHQVRGQQDKQRGLTSPAPALRTALIKDMMAVFRFTSSRYRPKLLSSSFSRVWIGKAAQGEVQDSKTQLLVLRQCHPDYPGALSFVHLHVSLQYFGPHLWEPPPQPGHTADSAQRRPGLCSYCGAVLLSTRSGWTPEHPLPAPHHPFSPLQRVGTTRHAASTHTCWIVE